MTRIRILASALALVGAGMLGMGVAAADERGLLDALEEKVLELEVQRIPDTSASAAIVHPTPPVPAPVPVDPDFDPAPVDPNPPVITVAPSGWELSHGCDAGTFVNHGPDAHELMVRHGVLMTPIVTTSVAAGETVTFDLTGVTPGVRVEAFVDNGVAETWLDC